MARKPITMHVERDVLAAIDNAAAASGVKRSRWMADTLNHVLTGKLLPADQIILDQVLKVRAQQELLLELVVDITAETDEQRLTRKKGLRTRVDRLFERYRTAAAEMLSKS